jgi:hypothetical protein
MVGTWFSLGTPASSTTKTGRHDIVKIFLKVALKHQKSINQSTLCIQSLNLNLATFSTSDTILNYQNATYKYENSGCSYL